VRFGVRRLDAAFKGGGLTPPLLWLVETPQRKAASSRRTPNFRSNIDRLRMVFASTVEYLPLKDYHLS